MLPHGCTQVYTVLENNIVHVPYKAIQTTKICIVWLTVQCKKIKNVRIYIHIENGDSFFWMKKLCVWKVHECFEYITRLVRIHTKPIVTDKHYTVMNNIIYACRLHKLKCICDLMYYVLQYCNTYCTIYNNVNNHIRLCLCRHLKIFYADGYIHNWYFNMLNKSITKNSLVASCCAIDWCGYMRHTFYFRYTYVLRHFHPVQSTWYAH